MGTKKLPFFFSPSSFFKEDGSTEERLRFIQGGFFLLFFCGVSVPLRPRGVLHYQLHFSFPLASRYLTKKKKKPLCTEPVLGQVIVETTKKAGWGKKALIVRGQFAVIVWGYFFSFFFWGWYFFFSDSDKFHEGALKKKCNKGRRLFTKTDDFKKRRNIEENRQEASLRRKLRVFFFFLD